MLAWNLAVRRACRNTDQTLKGIETELSPLAILFPDPGRNTDQTLKEALFSVVAGLVPAIIGTAIGTSQTSCDVTE